MVVVVGVFVQVLVSEEPELARVASVVEPVKQGEIKYMEQKGYITMISTYTSYIYNILLNYCTLR
jgi:hypothetical protein